MVIQTVQAGMTLGGLGDVSSLVSCSTKYTQHSVCTHLTFYTIMLFKYIFYNYSIYSKCTSKQSTSVNEYVNGLASEISSNPLVVMET
jgi:hypothetical protein